MNITTIVALLSPALVANDSARAREIEREVLALAKEEDRSTYLYGTGPDRCISWQMLREIYAKHIMASEGICQGCHTNMTQAQSGELVCRNYRCFNYHT